MVKFKVENEKVFIEGIETTIPMQLLTNECVVASQVVKDGHLLSKACFTSTANVSAALSELNDNVMWLLDDIEREKNDKYKYFHGYLDISNMTDSIEKMNLLMKDVKILNTAMRDLEL